MGLDGDAAPTGGQIYPWSSLTVDVNAVGQVAFSAFVGNTIGGSTDDEALYRWDDVGLPLVEIVRKGDNVPEGQGTLTGIALQSWRAFASPELNDYGQVAFIGAIRESGIQGDAGIYRGSGGPLTQIARVGNSAPGGGVYWGFTPASTVPLNNAGQVAFRAAVETGAVGGRPSGVFISDGLTATKITL